MCMNLNTSPRQLPYALMLGLLLSHAAAAQPELTFSTYLGGPQDDRVKAVTTDAQGNVYVAGRSFAPPVSSFPLAFPPFNTFDGGAGRGGYDVLVTKFTPTGEIVYSAILGGPGDDEAEAIAVDASGRVYITGSAGPDFPLFDEVESYQAGTEAFVTTLDSSGTSLLFSTYLSGALSELGTALAVDLANNIYVAGVTTSDQNTFVPTTPTFDNTANGQQDGFLAKINWLSPPAPRVVYKTFLGSPMNDYPTSLAVDASGSVVVGGETESATVFDHAPSPLVQTMYGGGSRDGFLLKINSVGVGAQFFTWLGGEDVDSIQDLVLTPQGEVWATGWTTSAQFPITANAIRDYPNDGGFNAWFARIAAPGNDLVYSSYWGGFMFDAAYSIVLADGDPVLVGSTDSANFQVTQDAYQPSIVGFSDLFITRFGDGGTTVEYSTFLGGNDGELFPDAAWHEGHLLLGGYTFSQGVNGYPTTLGAPQTSSPFPGNGFVTSMAFDPTPPGSGTHPADSDMNFRMTIVEITAYGSAWRTGTPWPTGPNPIPIDFVTQAGFLWRQGETYRDAGGTQPGNWVPDP
jgi:hypothetical protein